ncbi:zinc/iron-chelating domain-containing protein [Helicobacter sp. 12S02232-10]|uniref:YkgJ family cysteine cluster protein n=1 Tax=Helicobacter sp. 12S02232-10 TaxID=1476197 RepID=UPI000BA505E9|nr:YkgJ family cysteine cluster protein [Helicobacter sp. 12S02232-10]PAF46872.1 zinc/iron-chelating domain-containing protein [Helicobacter sp. 12S02232-10]
MVENNDFDFGFDGKECEDCGGKCCTGESGYIFATIDELLQVSDFLGISFDKFTQRYVKKVGYKFSFLEKKSIDGVACVFFDDITKKCCIYEVRPKQCVNFPFWEGYKKNNVTNKELENLCKLCKGVKCSKIS